MKKRLIGLILVAILGLCACNENDGNANQQSTRINDFCNDYLEKNQSEVITSADFEDEEVILFKNENEFGIASFFIADETEEIKYSISKIPIPSEAEKIGYAQIAGKSNYLIGIFIGDEALARDKKSIKVSYKDGSEDNLIVFEETTDKSNTGVITYESEEMREIKSIQILDSDNNEIYKCN